MLPEPLQQQVIDSSKDQFEVVRSLMGAVLHRFAASSHRCRTEGGLVARWIIKMAGVYGFL
jgi:hypothetical protein